MRVSKAQLNKRQAARRVHRRVGHLINFCCVVVRRLLPLPPDDAALDADAAAAAGGNDDGKNRVKLQLMSFFYLV